MAVKSAGSVKENKMSQKDVVLKLIEKGKVTGELNYTDIYEALPDNLVSEDKMEAILLQLEKMEIKVIEDKSSPSKKTKKTKDTKKARTRSSKESAKKGKKKAGSKDDADGGLKLEVSFKGKTAKAKATPAASSDFGTVTDPVKMYLREMGLVTQLSREGEIDIAKKIEVGELDVLKSMLETVLTVNKIIELAKLIEMNKLRPKSILRDIDESEAMTDERINIRKFINTIIEIEEINQSSQCMFCDLNEGKITRAVYEKKHKANVCDIYDKLKLWRLESNVLTLIGDMIYSQISWYKAMDSLIASFASLFGSSVSELTKHLHDKNDFVEWVLKRRKYTKKDLLQVFADLNDIRERREKRIGDICCNLSDLKKISKRIDRGRAKAKRAKAELIRANLRLVVSIAKKYTNRGRRKCFYFRYEK